MRLYIQKTCLYLQRLNMDIMQNMEHKTPLANNHISVDCVVIGFDGEQLKVLLIKRVGEEQGEIFHDMKLPGSLIYMDEDLDEAAQRVLNELTGLKNVNLMQFKAFGSKNRTFIGWNVPCNREWSVSLQLLTCHW